MQADNSQYIKALDQATAKLKQHSDDSNSIFEKIKDGLLDIGSEIAAGFAVEKIAEFAAASIEAGAQIERLAQMAGVSAEEIGALQIALSGSGVGADELSTSFKKLNVAASEAAGDATSKAGEAFRLLGINVKDSSGNIKDAATLNLEVADAFSKSADGANKVAIAVALYGRAGQQMIPTLNQGSAAIRAQMQAAIDAGAVFSGPLAAQTEDAEKAFSQLAATVKGELQVAIATQLAPAILQVIDAFKGLTSEGNAFQSVGLVISNLFKLIASAATEAKREIDLVLAPIQAVGAYAAAAVQRIQGNAAGAKAIIDDFNAQVVASQASAMEAQKKIWADGAQFQLDQAKKGAGAEGAGGGGKDQLGSPEALAKSDAAVKALQKYAEGIQASAGAFGLGEVASVRYKLSVGELSEELKIAGVEGEKAAASAVKYAEVLQSKKDTQTGDKLIAQLVEQGDQLNKSASAAFTYKINTGELGQALDRLAKSGHDLRPALEAAFDRKLVIQDADEIQKLNIKLLEMQGHLADAAKLQRDQANKGLRDDIATTGGPNAAGQLATIDATDKADDAMKKYNEDMAQATVIEAKYAQGVAALNLLRAQQSITDNQYAQQLNALQATQITQLGQVNQSVAQLAAQNPGIVALGNSAQEFQTKLVNLKAQGVDPLIASVRNNLESAFADNFSKLISGAESFKNALKGFMKEIEQMFIQMIAKDYAQKLFGAGGPAGGAAGGIANIFQGNNGSSGLGGISSLFSGFFAGGGNIPAGQWGVVGENGPEPAYGGSTGLTVKPNASMGGQTVVNHFTLPAQGGTISRQTQSQAATQVSRSLAIASRRSR